MQIMFNNGSLQLKTLDGAWLDTRVNGSWVKKYNYIGSLDDSNDEGTNVEEDEATSEED